jgi:hypothetical protein
MIIKIENKINNFCSMLRKPDTSLITYEDSLEYCEYDTEREAINAFEEDINYDVVLALIKNTDNTQSIYNNITKYVMENEIVDTEAFCACIYKRGDYDILLFSTTEGSEYTIELLAAENIQNEDMHYFPHFRVNKDTFNNPEEDFLKISLEGNKDMLNKIKKLTLL